MKRLWFIAILAASGSACVEGNNPVQLVTATQQEPESCEPDEVSRASGLLNFNVGSSYVITFGLFSPIEVPSEGDASPTAFFAQEVVYNYESKNPVVNFSEESRPIFFAVPVGASPNREWIAMDLIGSEARKKLEGSVPTAPDFMTLMATVKLRGKLPTGKQVETNELTYPINITRARGCAEGSRPAPPAEAPPCAYPGQDEYFDSFTCVPSGG